MVSRTADSRKIFVLDTSVILHDHRVLSSFEEHDVAVPMTVLEELDQFKKGNSELNRNAREFIRILDQLSGENLLQEWIPLNGSTSGRVRVIVGGPESHNGSGTFQHSESDHRILGAALALKQEQAGERKVILVSKDINLRLKARALELPAEDYKRVQIQDLDRLYSGTQSLELVGEGALSRLHEDGFLPADEVFEEAPPAHHFFVLTQGQGSALAWYEPRSESLRRIVKRKAYGITPRNAEQCFALEALLDPEVRLVSLTGPAGTGKTLLALAAALEQRKDFRQIYLARPIVPLSSKDIGFLPGDAQSKINPYMQPLWDNLSFIKARFDGPSQERKRIENMLEAEKLQIIPLAYIRGRSFSPRPLHRRRGAEPDPTRGEDHHHPRRGRDEGGADGRYPPD